MAEGWQRLVFVAIAPMWSGIYMAELERMAGRANVLLLSCTGKALEYNFA